MSAQSLPEVGAPPHSATCKGVRVGQVVARQVHEGAMLGVNELRLRGHVAGVLHGAGRVDHAHLQQRHNGSPNAEADTQIRTGRGQRRPKRGLDRGWRADTGRRHSETTAKPDTPHVRGSRLCSSSFWSCFVKESVHGTLAAPRHRRPSPLLPKATATRTGAKQPFLSFKTVTLWLRSNTHQFCLEVTVETFKIALGPCPQTTGAEW